MIEKEVVKENFLIAKDTYEMHIYSNRYIRPGQFINIKVDGFSLRRPISISSVEKGYYKIIYKIVGSGTLALSKVEKGKKLDILGPLGSPFPIHDDKKNILIIGGGVGVPPLYEVAKLYRDLDANVNVVLGFNDSESVFLEKSFSELGCNVYIATMDGSAGFKGNALELIDKEKLTGFVYACGPEKMLQAIESKFDEGYVSKEARMACGIGACMACVVKDKKDSNKYYRICKEGPVFEIGKVM